MTDAAARPLSIPLEDRAVLRVGGADWRAFLQGLLTQDVEGMADGETRYAALLTPQGRLLYDLFVTVEEEGGWLDVAADTRDALLARLKMYRLRARVELEAAEGEVVAFTGEADPGEGWRRDPRLAALGWRAIGRKAPAGSQAGTADDYERHRIRMGAGDLGRDGLADKAYALEANLDLLNGVDFRKGCFVGQETTSRMKRRNGVRSRLVPLRIEGAPPPAGTEVLAGELRAGLVCSGVEGGALALLRLDRAAAGGLTAGGRKAELSPPEWLEEALRVQADP